MVINAKRPNNTITITKANNYEPNTERRASYVRDPKDASTTWKHAIASYLNIPIKDLQNRGLEHLKAV